MLKTIPAVDIQQQNVEQRDRRNFVVLVLHQALMRIGWIFKTESVMMPLVLDTLHGGAWIRGAAAHAQPTGTEHPTDFCGPRPHALNARNSSSWAVPD